MGILNRTKKDDKKKDDAQKPAEKKAEAKDVKKPAAKKKTEKKTEAKKTEVKTSKPAMVISDVIIRPLVTEKSATLASANQYVFVVRKNANRIEVRSAIKAMYGVTPTSVNIQNQQGKRVRFGRRRGKRKDWKKAIVTLPAGKTINVYEGV